MSRHLHSLPARKESRDEDDVKSARFTVRLEQKCHIYLLEKHLPRAHAGDKPEKAARRTPKSSQSFAARRSPRRRTRNLLLTGKSRQRLRTGKGSSSGAGTGAGPPRLAENSRAGASGACRSPIEADPRRGLNVVIVSREKAVGPPWGPGK